MRSDVRVCVPECSLRRLRFASYAFIPVPRHRVRGGRGAAKAWMTFG